MFDLNKRIEVMSAVSSKYDGVDFELGTDNDCAHMIAYGLKQYGLKCSIDKYGTYRTEAGARSRLRKAGFSSLMEAVDAQGFFRLESAALAWPGDIIAFKGDNDDVALAWMMSNGRAFGFMDGKAKFVQPLSIEAAWRVE